jgi:hypothetical protein
VKFSKRFAHSKGIIIFERIVRAGKVKEEEKKKKKKKKKKRKKKKKPFSRATFATSLVTLSHMAFIH